MNRDKGLTHIFSKDNSFEQVQSTQPADYEGQLAIDVYQTPEAVIVEAPLAGVKPEDLNIQITDDILTVEGQRKREFNLRDEEFLVQECYWGSFSRSYILPVPVDPDRARASIKNGILRVILSKQEKSKTRNIKVEG
jgi:HSP20 family protein